MADITIQGAETSGFTVGYNTDTVSPTSADTPITDAPENSNVIAVSNTPAVAKEFLTNTTISEDVNNFAPASFAPAALRNTKDYVVSWVDGNRIGLEGAQDYEYTIARFFAAGGTRGSAYGWKATNGVLTQTARFDVVGGSLSRAFVENGEAIYSPTTGAPWSFTHSFGPVGTYAVGLAHIDANNHIGPASLQPLTVATRVALPASPASIGPSGTIDHQTNGNNLPAPTGLNVVDNGNDTFTLTCDAGPAASVGVVVVILFEEGRTAELPRAANGALGTYVELASGGSNFQVGDQIVITGEAYKPVPELHSRRIYNIYDGLTGQQTPLQRRNQDTSVVEYEHIRYDSLPVGERPSHADVSDGTECTQYSFQTTQSNVLFRSEFWRAGSSQGFYNTTLAGQTYRIKFHYWVNEACTMSVIPRVDDNSTATAWNLTPGWNTFELDTVCVATDTREIPFAYSVLVDATPTLVVRVGYEFVGDAGRPAFSNRQHVLDNAPRRTMFARGHEFIKNADVGSYDLETLLNPAGLGSTPFQRSLTFHGWLVSLLETGETPWIQIEDQFTAAEWLQFMEYMAATSGTWAAKRIANGQTTPWQTAFTKLRFELGNERWNTTVGFRTALRIYDQGTNQWLSAGTFAGMSAKFVHDTIRSSPHYDANKWTFVLGGWAANGANWNQDITAPNASDATRTDRTMVSLAAYNGGWDQGATTAPIPTLEDIGELMGSAEIEINPAVENLKAIADAINMRMLAYEAGPGYILNGLNGLTLLEGEQVLQERAMKSHGSGVAFLLATLNMLVTGFESNNFFLRNSGEFWRAFASPQWGGHPHPPWALGEIIHHELNGDIASIDVNLDVNATQVSYTDQQSQAIQALSVPSFCLIPASDPTCRILFHANRNPYPVSLDVHSNYTAVTTFKQSFTADDPLRHNVYPTGLVRATTPIALGTQSSATIRVANLSWDILPGSVHTFAAGARTVVSAVRADPASANRRDAWDITYNSSISVTDQETVSCSEVVNDFAPDATCGYVDLEPAAAPQPVDWARRTVVLAPYQGCLEILRGVTEGNVSQKPKAAHLRLTFSADVPISGNTVTNLVWDTTESSTNWAYGGTGTVTVPEGIDLVYVTPNLIPTAILTATDDTQFEILVNDVTYKLRASDNQRWGITGGQTPIPVAPGDTIRTTVFISGSASKTLESDRCWLDIRGVRRQ